ncbi:haloalkane dehalogenase [Flammeovirga aprica]|uniref:Alpha/beta fold hydrolase n=1 Tax=Flammeovirga aprica JL-4 TaxID=694437 RepID=A0A7X9RZZ5_9BACT|nr:haloalkane dehalogenase [Flammeovirga aprica]NME71880.1 alpha/beta fold hydrolase [Flammeovirga aprica JL-4]
MKLQSADLSSFSKLTEYPFTPRFKEYNGIKMHYIDEGEGETILALHGEPSWSYLYRNFIPVLSGYRFIAPDLIGFGKSDKLISKKDYSFELHYESLKHFISSLELEDITLIVQDWGGLLGLSVLGEFPEKFKRVVIMNTFLPKGKKLTLFFRLWQLYAKYHPSLPIHEIIQKGTFSKLDKATLEAYRLPFPNKASKAGASIFPSLVPSKPTDDGVFEMTRAREVLSKWNKPALVMFSDKDQVLGGMEKFFYKLIPDEVQTRVMIHNAGHFLQEEKGEELAKYIKAFMEGETVL